MQQDEEIKQSDDDSIQIFTNMNVDSHNFTAKVKRNTKRGVSST